MAKCKACGLDFASTNQTDEICYVCERALKRLNGYAVPVVRCKDCANATSYTCSTTGKKTYYCMVDRHHEMVEDLHFCGYGERRERE